MTTVLYCEQCDAQQPNDWKSGDLCVQCGGAVREEVRCAWCAHTTPNGKFCKHCGNEVQSDANFGPARILKSLGVDQLELTKKLNELSEPKLEQYRNQFNQHYAHIEMARQDLRRLESIVVIQGQEKFNILEKELLPQIPFSDDYIEKCKSYAKLDAPESDLEFLQRSKLFNSNINQELAKIAYLRIAPFPQEKNLSAATLDILNTILNEKAPFRQENVLFFSHINSFLPKLNWNIVAEKDELQTKNGKDLIEQIHDLVEPMLKIGYLKAYASLAFYHLLYGLGKTNHAKYDRFQTLAQESLDHHDDSLKLSAALLFNNVDIIVNIAKNDTPVGAYALRWLLTNEPNRLPDIAEGGKITKTQFSVLEEQVKFLKADYLKQLEHWEDLKRAQAQKSQDKINNIGNLYHNNSKYEEIRRENEEKMAELNQRKPQPPSFPEAFEKLCPKIIALITDATDYRAADFKDENGRTFYSRVLDFIGEFGSVSQQDIDAVVKHSKTYKQYDGIEALIKHDCPESLNYNEAINFWFARPEALKTYEEGAVFLQQAYLIFKAGNFPEAAALNRLLFFIKIHLRKINSKDGVTRGVVLNIFNALSEARHHVSYVFAQFFIEAIFNTQNFLAADWFTFITFSQGYLSGHYFIDSKEEPRAFTLTETFINDFFEGSWELFVSKYSQVISFKNTMGSEANHSQLIDRWIEPVANDFAALLLENPEFSNTLLEAHKEAKLLKNDGILQIQTEEGIFPFIEALGNKTYWDSGDVILYYHRHNDLNFKQPEACLNNFQNWLIRDNFLNYYGPVFDKYARHFFTFSVNSNEVPVGMIRAWLHLSAATATDEKRSRFFNDQFKCLVPYSGSDEMVTVMREGEDFQLTGQYVIDYIFNDFNELLTYVETNFYKGLNPDTNKFVLHALKDLGANLGNVLIEEDDKNKLMICLLNTGLYKENDDHEREFWTDPLLNVMLQVASIMEDKKSALIYIWQIADVHFNITDRVYEFVKEEIACILKADQAYGIKLLYAYLDDYYFGKHGAPWVNDIMEECVEDIARGFVDNPELMLLEVDNLLRYINKKAYDNDQDRIQREYKKHILNVLKHMQVEEIPDQFLTMLKFKMRNKELDFFFLTDLESWMSDNNISYQEDEEPESERTSSEEEAHTVNLEVPDEIDYDPDEISMDLMELSTFMSTFSATPENMTKLINHLPYYKKDRSNNPMPLSILMMKQAEIKPFLENDISSAINLYQKLLEIIIDPLCAPDGPFSAYGQFAAMQMQQLLEGSMFAMQYITSLEAMSGAGAYTPAHQQMIENTIETLKTQGK
ncbi:zinc ribbon domain-containing protein [Fulvivirga sediminis]|uniref:Zinc ribbon domain-containing protein n=1 Tax=Fulvivirga sediminis TaxID=2803949 RepID=A0A937FCB7_9BACT|nr:zinc ribbon domain-containing protein [Fulvivirga sediminis]MBL3657928.1 zinc ribbon domain-containing protein [Fulvivirga sediminis]